MSSQGMTWARQQKTKNTTAKAVLLLLGELVGDDGVTTRSQTQLGEILECNRDTIGRALGHLEKLGLIRRERRQASDTKRLPDRIILVMAETFTATRLPNDIPEEDTECAQNEHSKTEQREHANSEQRERANSKQSINSSLTPPQTSSADDGASAAPGELAIPGIPPKAEVALAITAKQGQVADWVEGQIQFGLKRPALFKLAQEPLERGFSAHDVAVAMKAVWFMDRGLNAQSLARYLTGVTQKNGHRAKPSTTNQRVGSALSRAEEYERTGRV
jgi:Pyocin large subunit